MNSRAHARTVQRYGMVLATLLLTAALAGGCWGKSSESRGITVKDGEVLLESADSNGQSSFTSEPYAGAEGSDEDSTTFAEAAADLPVTDSADTGSGVELATTSGGKPGLYGGTTDNGRCDRKLLANFLTDNDTKARAWVRVFNNDDTFSWVDSTGEVRSYLSTSDIPDFLDSLTPLILTRDTRVTNHGYRDGRAYAIQSVLQAGTAVFVDPFGVPRVKCACGNPLIPPRAVKRSVTYVGKPWKRFRPQNVINITVVNVAINIFVVQNPANPGTTIEVKPGSNASPSDTTTPTPTTTPSPDPSRETTTSPSSSDHPVAEGDLGPEEEIFNNGNIYGIENGGADVELQITKPVVLTVLQTYHWNDGQGSPAGTIYLRKGNGATVAKWDSTGSEGQGGVPSAYWNVATETFVEAGTYIVTDSSPETWGTNSEMGGKGALLVKGRYLK